MNLLEELRAAGAGGAAQMLLGCCWGRDISMADDPTPCPAEAVAIVVLHDGDRQASLKLCGPHRDRVMAESTPRPGQRQ